MTIPHGAATPVAARHATAGTISARTAHVGAARPRQGHRARHRRAGRLTTSAPTALHRRRCDPSEGVRQRRRGLPQLAHRTSRPRRRRRHRHVRRVVPLVTELTRFVASRPWSCCPYDTRDQVTSGVLVDAIAAGRPVIATAFPHAVELLGSGAGMSCRTATSPRSPSHPLARGHPDRPRREGRRSATALARHSLGPTSPRAISTSSTSSAAADKPVVVVTGADRLDHLVAMSDERGLFEHAEAPSRRVSNTATAPTTTPACWSSRRVIPDQGAAARLSRLALRFVLSSQAPDGRIRNRMNTDGRWTDAPATEDCWGRALWGFGAAAAHPRRPDDPPRRASRVRASAGQRSTWRRAMAFATLGAADVLSPPSRPRRGSSARATTPPTCIGPLVADDRLALAGAATAYAQRRPRRGDDRRRRRARRTARARPGPAHARLAAHAGDDGRRPPVGDRHRVAGSRPRSDHSSTSSRSRSRRSPMRAGGRSP